MVERITSTSQNSALMKQIAANQSLYNKLTQQIAAQKKITNIADDPTGAVNILNTTRQLGQISTFLSNAKLAKTEVSTLDSILDTTETRLQRGLDLAMQAANGTTNNDQANAIKAEVDQLIYTLRDLANTEYNGNYLFSGANTKTAAYDVVENADGTFTVNYNGTDKNSNYQRATEVSDGVFEVINTTGDQVYGYYTPAYVDNAGVAHDEEAVGIFGALCKLSNALGKEPFDAAAQEEVTAVLKDFNDSLHTITNVRTSFGAVYNRLEMTIDTLETNNVNLTEYKSNLEDLDLSSAVTEWTNAQYALQASMQVAGSTMSMSLLDYL